MYFGDADDAAIQRVGCHTLDRTRLHCFNRCRIHDIDPTFRHDDLLRLQLTVAPLPATYCTNRTPGWLQVIRPKACTRCPAKGCETTPTTDSSDAPSSTRKLHPSRLQAESNPKPLRFRPDM